MAPRLHFETACAAEQPAETWVVAAALAFVGFGLLAVTGWLGGSVAHEHRVGVIERLKVVRPAPHKIERAAS